LPAIHSLDAYTRSKTEAEVLLLSYAASANGHKTCAVYGGREVMLPHVERVLAASNLLPAQRVKEVVVLRPGFIYGRRDRTVLPKLLGALRRKQFVFFGDGRQAMNAIHVNHLVQAVFQSIDSDGAAGQVFNLTDGANVSKRDFVTEVAHAAGIEVPVRSIPLGLARILATLVHDVAAGLGAAKPPLINKARFKFLGLHLDYSVEKARRVLGYQPESEWRLLLRDAVQHVRRVETGAQPSSTTGLTEPS
jgi:nucleoside-diphosphate-sugar epimerase